MFLSKLLFLAYTIASVIINNFLKFASFTIEKIGRLRSRWEICVPVVHVHAVPEINDIVTTVIKITVQGNAYLSTTHSPVAVLVLIGVQTPEAIDYK